jgi:pimeloyl-ACP methyl ester carboxylesterase
VLTHALGSATSSPPSLAAVGKETREMNGLTQSVTVDRRARLLRFGALIAAALMLSLSALSTSARAESDPTIVLVHGAFASPAGWSRVADALHKDGYQTATPALGLASAADDVAIVRSTLDSIPGDKILVGHSYGGFVITNAASGRTDVRGLVYTAAYVPDRSRPTSTTRSRSSATRSARNGRFYRTPSGSFRRISTSRSTRTPTTTR